MGFSVDAGLLININEKWRMGLCVKDVNQPDVSLKDKSIVPMSVKLGVNYEMGAINVLADVTSRNYDYMVNAGAEWWINELPLAVRAGFGIGSRSYCQISTGASYRFIPLSGPLVYQFDYAFLCPLSGVEGTIGCHRVGMSIRIR